MQKKSEQKPKKKQQKAIKGIKSQFLISGAKSRWSRESKGTKGRKKNKEREKNEGMRKTSDKYKKRVRKR